jgi:hypothetical protein
MLPHSQQIFGLNGRNRQKSLVQNPKKVVRREGWPRANPEGYWSKKKLN